MRVHIVCYEDVGLWILGKIAQRLNAELNKSGIVSDIGTAPNREADINHHIIYHGFDGVPSTVDTLMITHVDTFRKLDFLSQRLSYAAMGICMSRQTMMDLVAGGLLRNKLCYINPAHDAVMVPRRLVIGITSKIFDDGRKLEDRVLYLAEKVEPRDFTFRIMGAGWGPIIERIRNRGFSVEYQDQFNHDLYREWIPTFDYYLYMGFDEGSMGFMDAAFAGVPTVVTPQGFHLDAPGGISHPFSTPDELVSIFVGIASERRKRMNSVKEWTWANYARKHVDVWRYLLGGDNRSGRAELRRDERDGLASVSEFEDSSDCGWRETLRATVKLFRGSVRARCADLRGWWRRT